MFPEWSTLLRDARKSMRVSRQTLATTSWVSRASIKAYELGIRKPSSDTLNAILDALRLNPAQANAIRLAAGFAPDIPNESHITIPWSISQRVESTQWPSCLMTITSEVVVTNSIFRKLLSLESSEGVVSERNGLLYMLDARFDGHTRSQLLNWEECMVFAISRFKGAMREGWSEDQFLLPLREKHSLSEKRYRFRRFLELWELTARRPSRQRYTSRLLWYVPGFGLTRFACLETANHEWSGSYYIDWIPTDDNACRLLDTLAAR